MDIIVARDKEKFISANLEEIKTEYSWEHLVDEHENILWNCLLRNDDKAKCVVIEGQL